MITFSGEHCTYLAHADRFPVSSSTVVTVVILVLVNQCANVAVTTSV